MIKYQTNVWKDKIMSSKNTILAIIPLQTADL